MFTRATATNRPACERMTPCHSTDNNEILSSALHNRPNFVLPLGKGAGKSATMLLQCQLPHVLYTGLEDYKQCVP